MGIQGLLSLVLGSHRGGGPELREGPREPPPEVGGGDEGSGGRGGTIPYIFLYPQDLVSQHGHPSLPLILAVPEPEPMRAGGRPGCHPRHSRECM